MGKCTFFYTAINNFYKKRMRRGQADKSAKQFYGHQFGHSQLVEKTT